MASLRRLQHVDRKDIYTNLEARIQYLHSFLDFNSFDIQALTVGSKYIRAFIPLVVEKVYKKLLQYDITARSFSTGSTSYEGPIDEFPSESSPQIQYRKLFLRGYLQKICSDPTKFEFWEYLDKVGMMHVGRGRKHPLHVEYIHIGACMGFIQDILFEEILSHPRLKLDRKIALVKAIGKVIWIQNDLFAKWHVRDGDDIKKQRQEPEVEQEGFLHGKMMLHADENSAGSGAESMSPAPSDVGTPMEELGQCPFTGMMDRLESLDLKRDTLPPGHPS